MTPQKDYRRQMAMARLASKRTGASFKILLPPNASTGPNAKGRNAHRKLTWKAVREMRRWAACEGYALRPAEQQQELARRYGVHDSTVNDVLTNHTWCDLNYEPGMPDESFWRGRSDTYAVLQLLARRNKGAAA